MLYNFVIDFLFVSGTFNEIEALTPKFMAMWRYKRSHAIANSHFTIPRHDYKYRFSEVNRGGHDFSGHPVCDSPNDLKL